MTQFIALLFTALLALPAAYAAGEEQELLEADKAFALTVRARDANTLEASWVIAPGYYMYRDKFKFESLDPGLALKPAIIPAGKIKDDPGFGKVETYTQRVTVQLPIGQRPATASKAKLRITSQGCNEPIGVCYPPVTKEITLALPAIAAAAAPQASGVRSLKDLAGLIGPGGQQEFLKPDEAFVLSTTVTDANTITAVIRIAPEYYLYRDKTSVALTRGDGVRLGTPEITRGKVKDDPYLGKTEVVHNELTVRVPLERGTSSARELELEIGYQGCAEKGICYPPETKKVRVQLLSTANADTAPSITTATTPPPKLEGDGFWSYVLAAFGAGLLLTFTPCVLPMIPILSGILVRSGDQTLTKTQAGALSYFYVLGTAVTYTAAGVLAGATGGQLQAYFQNPWAIGGFAAFLSVLALSMFGLFELQMPSFIQSKLHYHSHKTKGGTAFGAFFLGLVSALIVGACVSPVLIGVLGVAITNGDPLLGGAIMFAMAHGQGVALIAVGIGAGFILPRAGTWMDGVKYVFGVLLLGVAVYMLGYLPQVPVLLLWAVLLIVTGVYLGATQSLPHDASGWRFLWKGLGTFLLIWGALALLGGLMGERDILKPVPLAGMVGGNTAIAATAPAGELFHRLHEPQDLDAALTSAKREGKPVLLDYYADWCTDCVRMEATTFRDPRVRAALKNFVLLQADVTKNNDASTAMKKRFGVFGPPAAVLLKADGSERKDLRFYGYKNAEELLVIIAKL